jgi:hypothetical protein
VTLAFGSTTLILDEDEIDTTAFGYLSGQRGDKREFTMAALCELVEIWPKATAKSAYKEKGSTFASSFSRCNAVLMTV